MKCLDKDRTRRYETASALADDLTRYLQDELVEARPPSWGYRLRKAARRHKLKLAAAAVATVSLVIGLAPATVGFLRASADRDLAVRAVAVAAEQQAAALGAKEQAELARAQAVAVNELLHQVFVSANRRRTGDETALRRALDEAAAKVDAGTLKDQPELEAAVRTTVGNTYLSWGYLAPAEGELRAALGIRRKLAPREGDVDLAKSLADLGWLLLRKHELDEAEAMLREALQMRRGLLGERSPAVADTMYALAVVLLSGGNREGARPLVKESLSIRLGQYDAQLAKTPGDARLVSLRGHTRARAGDMAGAAADYSAAIEAQPEDAWNWFQRTSLRLYAGEVGRYRADCRELLKRFGDTRSPETADRTAKACLLDPDCAADPSELASLGAPVDRAISSNSPPAPARWFEVTKGMYEYRCGRYNTALEWLGRGRAGMKPASGRALADFFSAMALHRLGREGAAKEALAAGIRLTPDNPLDVAGSSPGSQVGRPRS